MSVIITDSRNYTDIAEAIRGKGIGGTLKPREMAGAISRISSSEQGGISDGIAVTERDSAGNPTAVTVYGSTVYPYTCGAGIARTYKWLGSTVRSIEFADRVTELKAQAFYYTLGSDTDLNLPAVTSIGNQAFFGSNFKSVRISPSAALGNEVFRTSSITDIVAENAKTESNTSQSFRQWTGASAVCGSVGNPWVISNNTFLGAANAETVTVFCKGANANSNLNSIRNGAINATIIIKASEATTYNGTSYNAGDIMITSAVEVNA